MREMRKAAPWTEMLAKAIATVLREDRLEEEMAVPMRVEPNGAVRRRGYAGNTQIGVIV